MTFITPWSFATTDGGFRQRNVAVGAVSGLVEILPRGVIARYVIPLVVSAYLCKVLTLLGAGSCPSYNTPSWRVARVKAEWWSISKEKQSLVQSGQEVMGLSSVQSEGRVLNAIISQGVRTF